MVSMSDYLYIMSIKQDISDELPPGLTFREKTLWSSLVSTVVVYAYYFWQVLRLGDGDPVLVAGVFIQVVIVMIVSQIVITAALAIHRRPERIDERDRRIAAASTRYAYYVLMTGVWGALGVGAMSLGTFWVLHAGLLAIVLAEITRCAAQLVHYRRAA
jgi:hypothetical protein